MLQKNKQSDKAYAVNQDLLLVSLYSLTPPLRKEVMSLQFADHYNHDKTADFVNFTKKGSVELQLNLHKKWHGAITIPLSQELGNILKKSYVQYQRKHLFTDARKFPNVSTPVEEATVADRLRKTFIKKGVDIGPSILRASYVSFRFNQANWRLSVNEIEDMARLMHTSSKYILSSYRKNTDGNAVSFVEDEEDEEDDTDDEGHGPPEDANANEGEGEACESAKEVKEDPYVKYNVYLVKKYKTDDQYKKKVLAQQKKNRASKGKLAHIYRPKLVRLLKRSAVYRDKVKQETLDKYGIKAEDYM